MVYQHNLGGLFGKSVFVAFITFLAKGAAFIAMALVARALSPNDMGFLDLSIFIFMTLMPLGALNVTTASSIFISTDKNKKKLAFSLMITLILFYGLISFLAYLLLPFLLAYLGINLNVSLALIALCGFLFVLHTFSLSAFQGLEDFKIYSLLLSLQPIIFLATQLLGRIDNSLLYIFSSNANAVLQAYFLSYLVPALVSTCLLFKTKQKLDFAPALQVFKYSAQRLWWPILLGAITGFYIRSLVFINDPINNAILRILDQYSQILIIPVSAFVAVIFPKLSQAAVGQIDCSLIKMWLRKYIGIVLLTGFVVSIVGVFLVPLVFGSKYIPAVGFIGIYGIFIIISFLSSFVGQLSLANSKWTYLWFNSAIILNFVNIAMALSFRTLGVIEILAIYMFDSIFVVAYFAFATRHELGLDKMLVKQAFPIIICFVGILISTTFVNFLFILGPILFALLIFVLHKFKFVTLQEIRQMVKTMSNIYISKFRELLNIISR